MVAFRSTYSPLRVFEFKLFQSYSFKECTYLLIKTIVLIFSLIFLKISGRAEALQPLQTNHFCIRTLFAKLSPICSLSHKESGLSTSQFDSPQLLYMSGHSAKFLRYFNAFTTAKNCTTQSVQMHTQCSINSYKVYKKLHICPV
jgi:hypothetical protein